MSISNTIDHITAYTAATSRVHSKLELQFSSAEFILNFRLARGRSIQVALSSVRRENGRSDLATKRGPL